MREPNIKELIEGLAEEDFVEGIFQRHRDAYEEISQLMYFLRKEQVATLYNEISELQEEKKQKVFTSLVNLYPLSRNIIKHLVIKREKNPVEFLRIYDYNKELLTSFKDRVSEIKELSYSNSSEYNNYQRELEKLANEIDKLEDTLQNLYESRSELKEKREKKAQLEKEISEIEYEYNHSDLNKEIESLNQNIEIFKNKTREMKERNRKLQEELDEMKNELDKNESDPVYRDALMALRNCIKAIPGER